MCGFGGIIGYQEITIERLADVARQVNHRGPDFTGLRLYDQDFILAQEVGTTAIFHNRLAIIDLDARSNQPFEDEHHILVFNGEIYNYVELRTQLRQLGYVFLTSSDTEVLFYILKHFGAEAVKHLNGMFAFAFIDKQRKTLLLARDRVGIKPLYYAWRNTTFIFASEIDTVIRLGNQSPQVDLQAAELFQVFQYVPASRSIWEGVQSLLPGHLLKFDFARKGTGKVDSVLYWDAYTEPRIAEPESNLAEVLRAAVGRQLVADVPIGVFLSSGVDSSLLAAVISKHFQHTKPSFYTVGFNDGQEYDESARAKFFLEQLGVSHSSFNRLEIGSMGLSDDWQQLYNFVDQPFGDHAILLNWAIAREVANHVKVVLSGDGGDEIFAGYDRYLTWANHRRQYSTLMMGIMRALSVFLPRKGLYIRSERNLVIKYLLMLDSSNKSPEKIRKLLTLCDFSKNLNALLLRNDLPRLIDMKGYLPDGMLFKVDRSSMAASIEVRVPFLDNEIIDIGLRETAFIQGRPLKWQLRELLGQMAPHFDLDAPKRGFSFPLLRWMRERWFGLLQEIIYDSDRQAVGIEDELIFSTLKSFKNGNDNVGYALWIQANLLLWHRTKVAQLRGAV